LEDKTSQRIKKKVIDRLRFLENEEKKHKASFVILLLYPGFPIEEKERVLRIKEKLKLRKWKNVFLLEDFGSEINLSDLFDCVSGDKGLSPDLIAAIFTEKGRKEGESWEL